jgi:hypothetical protein
VLSIAERQPPTASPGQCRALSLEFIGRARDQAACPRPRELSLRWLQEHLVEGDKTISPPGGAPRPTMT